MMASFLADRVRYARERKPAPVAGSWCWDARDEPNTGLVCFPDLDQRLPGHVAAGLAAGHGIGVAIGDVDGLTEYVEAANQAGSWGHQAGNELMRLAGLIAREWFAARVTDGCLSTFGGDEIVLVAESDDADRFQGHVDELRGLLCDRLACTVSFAVGYLDPASFGPWLCATLLGGVDRALFERKSARRRGGDVPAGFLLRAPLALVPGRSGGC
ncbi:GGDEF domain-containing protein [Actinocatenispora sera]|uniref:GGDEF domain-containing protein n=1 Tax=Actinocatenispora sera TaxID=390989 RepID=UPI0033C63174